MQSAAVTSSSGFGRKTKSVNLQARLNKVEN